MSKTTQTPATDQNQPAPVQGDATPPQTGEPAQRDADKPLGEPGLKALQAERERADRLEREINSLKPLQQQFDALKNVFGGQTAEDAKPEDVVKSIQTEWAEMRQQLAVEAIARQYGITEEADLKILKSASSPELMQQWGERLKSAPKSPAPEPDPGQGARTGTQSESDAEYSQFEQFFPSKSRK